MLLFTFLLKFYKLQLIHRLPFCDGFRTKVLCNYIVHRIAESSLCVQTEIVCFNYLL